MHYAAALLNRRGIANCLEAGASIKPIKAIYRNQRAIAIPIGMAGIQRLVAPKVSAEV
jgi:hypothetical protein